MTDVGVTLEVDSLTKRYGDRCALDDVSLNVTAGEVCGLLGPNGAGKTTLVSIVAGLRKADSGCVRVAGLDVATGGRAARSQVGLAAQETGVYPTVTVRENLVLFADLAGYRKSSETSAWRKSPTFSNSRTCSDGWPATFPVVRSGDSTRRWRCCIGHAFSCWTSRPQVST